MIGIYSQCKSQIIAVNHQAATEILINWNNFFVSICMELL